MRALLIGTVSVFTFIAASAITAQERTYKNSVGMEFVLVQPGQFVLGRFQPPYAKPPDPDAPPPQPPGAGQAIGAGLVQLADTNGDQRISREEFAAVANTWFDRIDEDKTGRVAQAEFATRFGAIQAQLAGGGAGGRGAGARGGGGGFGGGGRGGQVALVLFTAADTNRDGSVSREELSGRFGTWFDSWDTGKAGALSPAQLIAKLNEALPLPAGGGRAVVPPTAQEYQQIAQAAAKDAREGFQVTISQPYYIGTYEVTQAQYRQVMGANPSFWQAPKVDGPSDSYPVDSVTWDNAQAFVRKLNEREKTNVYRLPTEFEWEYAARAGATDDIPWNDIRQQAWNVKTGTQPVGKMKPNAWGLYDTLGNVWEWVQDYYNEKLFADPTPPRSGKEHVLKGGGFLADVKNLTYMWHGAGPGNKFDVGFRIVREVR